jgi:hypothetical protein
MTAHNYLQVEDAPRNPQKYLDPVVLLAQYSPDDLMRSMLDAER